MITITQGDILKADTDALVNTVNCVGVMGKGIALLFKKAYPENFKSYEKACHNNEVVPGKMFIFANNVLKGMGPRFIINFPTKRHWRNPSSIEDISMGLTALKKDILQLGIESIAIPPLGCGNGGLDWPIVKRVIIEELSDLKNVDIRLYSPISRDVEVGTVINTHCPKLTRFNSTLILLIHNYLSSLYEWERDLTKLEIQKLAYFEYVFGDMDFNDLKFKAELYGPYSTNLSHAMHNYDGHFMSGCRSDNAPLTQIKLKDEYIPQASDFLKDFPEVDRCIQKVNDLIEGFQTPFGMELLSSVHWVAKESPTPAFDVETAVIRVHEWNARKAKIFTEHHISVAWNRLKKKGLI